jgi:Ca-activated chloride channel family protein
MMDKFIRQLQVNRSAAIFFGIALAAIVVVGAIASIGDLQPGAGKPDSPVPASIHTDALTAPAEPEGPARSEDSFRRAFGAPSIVRPDRARAQALPTAMAESGDAHLSDESWGRSPAPATISFPAATTFRDYLRTRTVSAADDAVATFSLDTDRTSFQLALNWIDSGYAVEPDSVRAEEWINAFDYRYAKPLRGDSFAISSALIEHPLHRGKYLARLAFQAPEVVDHTPLNVTLVMDASGSMGDGNRVAIARAAAESIRLSLGDEDRIAVVQFSTDVIDDLTVEHAHPDSRSVRRSLEALRPRNSTNVQAGLDRGVRIADRARWGRPGAHNYVILFSDGVANVNATDPFGILESVGRGASDNPLRLITIGVGVENFNDYLLEQLAQHGNGWYRYLSDVGEAKTTFRRDSWLAISVPFADQARAQITWDDEVVSSWRLIGYENRIASDESFAHDRREFAEIPAGSATTAFFELELRRPPTGPGMRLGNVELRWVTPISGDSNRQHAPIRADRPRERDFDDAMLRFGAIVALASDRYSSLWAAEYADRGVGEELAVLRDELGYLEPHLGELGAFHDFRTVLGHLVSLQHDPAASGSGYSR